MEEHHRQHRAVLTCLIEVLIQVDCCHITAIVADIACRRETNELDAFSSEFYCRSGKHIQRNDCILWSYTYRYKTVRNDGVRREEKTLIADSTETVAKIKQQMKMQRQQLVAVHVLFVFIITSKFQS